MDVMLSSDWRVNRATQSEELRNWYRLDMLGCLWIESLNTEGSSWQMPPPRPNGPGIGEDERWIISPSSVSFVSSMLQWQYGLTVVTTDDIEYTFHLTTHSSLRKPCSHVCVAG